MDHAMVMRTQAAFTAYANRYRNAFPVTAALAAGLGASPHPAVLNVLGRFWRIVSTTLIDVPAVIAGLHYLALRGDAPDLARYFPTCGGEFHPTADADALTAAAGATLAARGEDVLDFLLDSGLQPHVVQRSVGLFLGALATADRFPGPLCVVEAGCSAGLNLRFDAYAYRLGAGRWGDSPLVLSADVVGLPAALAAAESPVVTARYGLDQAPPDLSDEDTRLRLAACLWPDQAQELAQFNTAVGLRDQVPIDFRQGLVELDLAPLLFEAYNAMAPGTTLLLCHTFLWTDLDGEQQRIMASAVQQLAARLQPHKPLAWLQVEPTPAGLVELKLHTFGWADQEDRAVRKLAEASPDLRAIRWLE